MKNRVITIVLVVLLGVGVFFIGRGYYYNNIYNYSRIIHESLEKFYVSSETTDLEPIAEVKDTFENNEKKTADMQNEIYNEVKGWVDYLNNKYICDSNNVNSCRLYYNELINMKANIRTVYIYREQLISQSKFTSLISELDMKAEEVKEIIDDPASVRSRNYEELRLEKCSKTTECSECRTLFCDCIYVNSENKKEIVKCKVPEPADNRG